MPVATVPQLLQDLQRLALLEPPQLAELPQVAPAEPMALGRLLLDRGWLTPYQANQLLLGRAAELRLGSYIILERRGEAPAGVVFTARHHVMRRLADVIVVRPDLLARPEAVARFYEEVQAVSRLSATHLVAAYDAGPAGATHFVALEHVEGIDLYTLVQRDGPLPVSQACAYVCQAATGLHHASQLGLFHQDLRPANLLLSSGGTVKVRNLGLSILQPTRQVGTSGVGDWAAPECADGQLVDAAAEAYSLGCILHFLLVGTPPGPAPAPVELLRNDVPEPLAALTARLLRPDPAQRCQALPEVIAVLQEISATPSWQTVINESTAKLPRVGRQPAGLPLRWLVGGAVALTIVALLFAALLLRQLFARPETDRAGQGAPLTFAVLPPKPGPPALVVQCGKGGGNQQDERVQPGFGYQLVQGEKFDGWDGSPKRHCWHHAKELRFNVQVPPGTAGVLRLHCLDADSLGRRQVVFVDGKQVERLETFIIPGANVEVNLSAADTRKGVIEVRIENISGAVNAVVSTVEFLPLMPSAVRNAR